MMDIADGQNLPGGNVSHNDAYYMPQDVFLCQDSCLGHSVVVQHCFRISRVKYGKLRGVA